MLIIRDIKFWIVRKETAPEIQREEKKKEYEVVRVRGDKSSANECA